MQGMPLMAEHGEVKIWNKRRTFPDDAVYVGRPSPWGNPFTVRLHGQDDAVALHKEWISEPEQRGLRERARRELRDRDLLCWCAPLPCHAHTLADVARSADDAEWEGR